MGLEIWRAGSRGWQLESVAKAWMAGRGFSTSSPRAHPQLLVTTRCAPLPPCLPAFQTVPVLGSSALRQITSGEMFLGVAILVGGISAVLDSIPTSTLKSVDLRLDNKLDKRNYEVIGCSTAGIYRHICVCLLALSMGPWPSMHCICVGDAKGTMP